MKRIQSILIIEDDASMRTGLKDNLEIEGYRIICASTMKEGVEAVSGKPDLILLDVMLPDGDGIKLCKQLRTMGILQPIIMLTARGEEMDKVLGLESGADDYIVKPFSLRELLARIHAHLRRHSVSDTQIETVVIGVAEVNFSQHILLREGKPVDISAKEMDILHFLVRHRGRVISRDTLLLEIWGHAELIMTRTVDNFMVRLRKKIEPDPANPRYLITVHGTGYKLVEQ